MHNCNVKLNSQWLSTLSVEFRTTSIIKKPNVDDKILVGISKNRSLQTIEQPFKSQPCDKEFSVMIYGHTLKTIEACLC